jgi:uncharacterized protein (UPF0548 family)
VLLLREPSESHVRHFLAEQRALPFSYPEVGASRRGAPPGYPINHARRKLGVGSAIFTRAVDAVTRWQMYAIRWTRLLWPDTPIAEGATVGILVRHFGFWSLNACRIVYRVDEDGAIRRYGFAFGTLPGHTETGEERFTVEWRQSDDSVWYELFAFARPRHALAKAGYPLTRFVQKRFAADSQRAMLAAVSREQT